MGIEEHKREIIVFLEKMEESDRKFLNQILTLIRTHLKRTGRL